MLKNQEKLLRQIGEIADLYNVKVFAVGGFIRDMLLSKSTDEIDFMVLGDGPAFASVAVKKMRGRGLVTFPQYGTANFISGDFKFEFVSARREVYRENSRNPDVEISDFETDIKRRDFTVNTLAARVTSEGLGEIIDMFNGKRDIEQKIIRTPLDPETTFADDPLRIMRAARFASQLGFTIEENTLKAMESQKERLSIISQERITDELMKILSHKKPSVGLNILYSTGILAIIFPELTELVGVEQIEKYHHKDVFEHTLKVVDNIALVTDNLNLRFAGLVHDIGKPRVKEFVEGTGWTFHGHEIVGMRMLPKICMNLKLSRSMCKYAQKLTKLHMRPVHLVGEEVTDSAIRRLIVTAGEDLDDLMILCRADITSGNPARVKKHLSNFDYVERRIEEVKEKDKLREFQSPVRGEEIMKVCGLKPGPMVGILKKAIEEAILDGKIPNDHDAAYEYLLSIKDQFLKK
ncbi:tRNA nucleotidyltransferase [candidate division KSB1 bacterium]|nr:MAG: tRNA nucleotidyltransferase [candidate division KSB1 bacterium]